MKRRSSLAQGAHRKRRLGIRQGQVNITIGKDQGTASELEKTGAKHSNCDVERFVVDTANKIITSPAYMDGSAKPHQIFEGVSGAIKELIKMA